VPKNIPCSKVGLPPIRGVHSVRIRHHVLSTLDTIYLDHAGTTLYAKSLIERFSADMMSNLYGNPHSASNASQLTTRRIEDIRLALLQLFHADPQDFDVIFVANATAGIKLVMDAFRDQDGGFWYGYHRDAHTSLIGVREAATEHRCFASDAAVGEWIEQPDPAVGVAKLFAYPAQSNMNGRRLPLDWSHRVRTNQNKAYTLLDAAALVATSSLDLGDADKAPDFTVFSLYKMFGFPDLGAVIVRQASASLFDRRRYFGGGTVEMVVCLGEQWHARKTDSLHERLEDGTLPIHSIMALGSAMAVHQALYGSLERVSRHTSFLAEKLYSGLSALQHGNGTSVCHIYQDPTSAYGDARTQGPIVAFNLRSECGGWISNAEVEKLAAVKNLHLRTGGLCNPGGVASSLGLAPWEMRDNFSAGQRCGKDDDRIRAKPTGMIRVSFGAMSVLEDVYACVDLIREYFVQASVGLSASAAVRDGPPSRLQVESLTVYPIKSCAGFPVPPGRAWAVRAEGLAWDREWCLLHQGTGAALSQKRYPQMALLRPSIDLEKGMLRVRVAGALQGTVDRQEIAVPLSADPRGFGDANAYTRAKARVCGEAVEARRYRCSDVSRFFSQALGVACHLARLPAGSTRGSKGGVQTTKQPAGRMPGAFPDATLSKPIVLSNESPILTICRASLNRLNEAIKAAGGKAAQAEVFRANIVVAETADCPPGREEPFAEDEWRLLQIGGEYFAMLGGCRRCQMICVDQQTGERNPEPFVTLSKTRRLDGRVYFGEHGCHVRLDGEGRPEATIMVGDAVRSFRDDELQRDRGLRGLVG